jgi:hypothetical protein
LPTNPAGTLAWYSASTGGTALSTSSSYVTASLTSTTSYYVEAKTTATGCISATRSVCLATINAIPPAPTAGSASRCGSGTVTLSATPGSGQTIDWYSASTSGTLLLSNNVNYTTPSISTSTTYYATAKNTTTNCISSTRTAVVAKVISILAAPSSLTGLTSICSIVGTATSTRYTATAVTGATSYTWTIPSGAVIDSGSNGLKIRVRFNSAGSNDSIFVQANNGCLGAKKILKLVTSGCATTPLGKGEFMYSSKWTDYIRVYPNPSSNAFIVHSLLLNNQPLTYRILDIQGRLLQKGLIDSDTENKVGSQLKPGV